MSNLINSNINNALASMAARAPAGVMGAIRQASAKTGVNFAYLVQQAAAESGFKPDAKAKTSSASGLYQFIESTWMNMVEKYGAKYGISTEGKSRKEVLAMRNDPEKASVMAAEFAGENERFLKTHYKGEIGSTELYLAHFLGAGGAAAFLNARAENGMAPAAHMLPAAAKANRNVFYDAQGRAKSLDEVYAQLDGKFGGDSSPIEDLAVRYANNAPPPPPPSKPDPRRYASYQGLRMAGLGSLGAHNLVSNRVEILMMAQMDLPLGTDEGREFNLFSARSPLNSHL